MLLRASSERHLYQRLGEMLPEQNWCAIQSCCYSHLEALNLFYTRHLPVVISNYHNDHLLIEISHMWKMHVLFRGWQGISTPALQLKGTECSQQQRGSIRHQIDFTRGANN